MSTVSQELVEIVDKLPEEKAREVVDFARFLQQQTGDLAWERIINDTRPRPKLDAFVAAALREEPAEPLNTGKL
ncbi:MAG: DUF2281 domain-containing protein [Verrucomicrobiota bacterium]